MSVVFSLSLGQEEYSELHLMPQLMLVMRVQYFDFFWGFVHCRLEPITFTTPYPQSLGRRPNADLLQALDPTWRILWRVLQMRGHCRLKFEVDRFMEAIYGFLVKKARSISVRSSF